MGGLKLLGFVRNYHHHNQQQQQQEEDKQIDTSDTWRSVSAGMPPVCDTAEEEGAAGGIGVTATAITTTTAPAESSSTTAGAAGGGMSSESASGNGGCEEQREEELTSAGIVPIDLEHATGEVMMMVRSTKKKPLVDAAETSAAPAGPRTGGNAAAARTKRIGFAGSNENRNSSIRSNKSSSEEASLSLASNSNSQSGTFGSATTSQNSVGRRKAAVISLLMVFFGGAASAAFLYLGISAGQSEQEELFYVGSGDAIREIELAWFEYASTAAWVHQSASSNRDVRGDFYQYCRNSGNNSTGSIANLTRFDDAVENSAADYFRQLYENLLYQQQQRPTTVLDVLAIGYAANASSLASSAATVTYLEPSGGIDYESSDVLNGAITTALETWEPSIAVVTPSTSTTTPSRTEEQFDNDRRVILVHPGVPKQSSQSAAIRPSDVALVSIPISSFLRSTMRFSDGTVYIYDSTDSDDEVPPVFLGAVRNLGSTEDGDEALQFLPERDIDDVRLNNRHRAATIAAQDREWTVVVVAAEGALNPVVLFVILGGAILLVAPLCVSLWMYTNARRLEEYNSMKAAVRAQKSALIVESARKAAVAERELNDYIA